MVDGNLEIIQYMYMCFVPKQMANLRLIGGFSHDSGFSYFTCKFRAPEHRSTVLLYKETLLVCRADVNFRFRNKA